MRKFLRWLTTNFQYIFDQFGNFFRVLTLPLEFEKRKNTAKHSNKIERFTKDARDVFFLTTDVAEILGHDKMEIEHLLLAMARANKCIAHKVLTDLQIDETQLLEQITRFLPATGQKSENPDLSQDLKNSLQLSVDIVLATGRYQGISTADLLIGIMRVNKPEISSILAHFGTDAKTVIEHTEAVLKQQSNSKRDER